MNIGGCCYVLALLSRIVANLFPSSRSLALLLVLGLAVPLQAAQVTLTWNDNSSNESGFKIERATNSGGYGQIALVGANVTSYVDTNLASGSQYSYRVRAYNAAGDSAYSNVVTHATASAANTAPTISTIADQALVQNGTSSPIGFSIGDAETAASSLAVSATSSNTTLIPSSGIVLGGSGSSRSITITPAANQSGSATVTVKVSDGTNTTSTSFAVTVTALQVAPTNTAPVITSLQDQTINVGGTLSQNFKISDAQTGAGSLLVSGTSSDTALIPANGITFSGKGGNRTVTVKPAAGRSGKATITVSVSDGSLTGSTSFQLSVGTATNTPPTISAIDDQILPLGADSGPIPFTVSDAELAASSLTLSGTSSNNTLVPLGGVLFGGSGGNRTVTVKPAAGQTGTATITVKVSDGSLTSTATFDVTVANAAVGNTPPSISSIVNQTITQNGSTSALGFKVSDAETAATKLTITAVSSQPNLIPVSNIRLGGSGGERTVTVSPAKNMTGSAMISLAVHDAGGLTATTNFEVTVLPTGNGAPEVTQQPVSQFVTAGGNITLTVAAKGTPSPSYYWRKDGVVISGATSQQLTLSNVKDSDAGLYDVVVSNSKGTVTSDLAIVSVGAPNFEGTYFGSIGQTGTWALYVRGDNTGTFIGTLPERNISVVLELKVSSNGSLTVTSTKVNSLATGGISAAAFDGAGEGRFVSSQKVGVTGVISDGQVIGEWSDVGAEFVGVRLDPTGPVQALAGYLTASGDAGGAYSIVGATGDTIMVLATTSGVDAVTGSTQPTGKFTGTSVLGGHVVTTIDPKKLTVAVAYAAPGSGSTVQLTGRADHAPSASKFINVSIRTKINGSAGPLITGFVVQGEGEKSVLMRGVGPALEKYGVGNYLPNPSVALYRGQKFATSNDDWGNASTSVQIVETSTKVGAFPLPNDSRDAVLHSSLEAGAYSAHVNANGQSGVALGELYDADVKSGTRLINVSARSFVGTGDDVLIVGFVISGEGPRKVLIRAVGPTLNEYGVTGTLADPTLQLFQGEKLLDQNDDWGGSSTVAAAFSTAGAFQLNSPTSKDAALVVTLQPGVYSAIVAGSNGGTGEALLELYELP